MITAAGDDDGGKVRKRPRPFRDGEIGLSPKQWRMLQDKPSLLEIDFGQCVAWKGIREIPIEDVNGFGPLGMTIKESDEGPDLSSIAEFFGLDEPRTSSGEVRVPENFREIERLG